MSTIERRWQRLIVVAAILMAAAIVAATQYLHPPEPAAAVGPDAPPQGVPLFYFIQGGRHHTLIAYDWSGQRRGSITLPTWVDTSRVRMAPDGSSFVIDPASDGDWLGYFDRLGNTVMETDNATADPVLWADDNRHLCMLDGADIVVRLPGSPDRSTRLPDQVYNMPGQHGLVACSMRTDAVLLAAVDEPGDGSITVVRVKLSTGKALNTATFPPAATVVVSSDAALVAVGLGADAATAVYRASDLTRPVARLDPSFVPMAFSGDTSLLTTFQSGTLAGLQLIDWKSGKQRWLLVQFPNTVGQVLAQPSGTGLAFALVDSGGNPNGIFIVHRDGTSTQLAYGRPVTW
jgi:hypothetical protein